MGSAGLQLLHFGVGYRGVVPVRTVARLSRIALLILGI
jgi:hypothetical protein